MPVFALAAILAAGASAAQAGILATTPLAYNDGFGPDGGVWRGSFTISATSISSDVVEATVDYAVFPPGGRFGQYLTDNGLGGADPSAPGEAVYAYQISSVTSAVPGISALSVGLDSTDLVSLITSVATGVAGEVSPTSSSNQGGTSAFWDFNTSLGPGDVSSLLVITSPSEPELDTLQLSSGLAIPNPNPMAPSLTDTLGSFREVPEPTSVCLALGFLMGTLSVRRARC